MRWTGLKWADGCSEVFVCSCVCQFYLQSMSSARSACLGSVESSIYLSTGYLNIQIYDFN